MSEIKLTSIKVEIDGHEYCLGTVPNTSDKLVEDVKRHLKKTLDLQKVAAGLSELGRFWRTAHYRVVGNVELELKIQDVGKKVAGLCKDSDYTVVSFGNGCVTVIDRLRALYEYLSDGHECTAFNRFRKVAETAENMAKSSGELREKFRDAIKSIEDTMKCAMKEKGKQEKTKAEKRKIQATEETRREQAVETEQNATKNIDLRGDLYVRKMSMIEKAMTAAQPVLRGLFKEEYRLMALGMRYSNQQTSIVRDEIERESRRIDDARSEWTELANKLEGDIEAQKKAKSEMQQSLQRIQQAKSEEEVAIAAIDALHITVSALRRITKVVDDATTYWLMLRDIIVEIFDESNKDMQSTMEDTMEHPEEDKRREVWRSDGFIKEGIRHYAKWVALKDHFEVYSGQLREAENEMNTYLSENPTADEAQEKLPELAASLKKSLDDDLTKLLGEKLIKDRGDHIAAGFQETQPQGVENVEYMEMDWSKN